VRLGSGVTLRREHSSPAAAACAASTERASKQRRRASLASGHADRRGLGDFAWRDPADLFGDIQRGADAGQSRHRLIVWRGVIDVEAVGQKWIMNRP